MRNKYIGHRERKDKNIGKSKWDIEDIVNGSVIHLTGIPEEGNKVRKEATSEACGWKLFKAEKRHQIKTYITFK